MKKKASLYQQALQFLISNDLIFTSRKTLYLSFKYPDLKFDFPTEIDDLKIVYLHDMVNQELQFAENGVLRVCEIEPIEVISNYLQLKLNTILSIKSDEKNYESMLSELTKTEKESLSKITGSRKSIDLSLNLETFLVDFIYNCELEEFHLSKYKRMLSIA